MQLLLELDGARSLRRLMELWDTTQDESLPGLTLPQFVRVLSEVLPEGLMEDKVDLTVRIISLFREIDVDFSKTVEHEELVSFIADAGALVGTFGGESGHHSVRYTERADWVSEMGSDAGGVQLSKVIEWPHPFEVESSPGYRAWQLALLMEQEGGFVKASSRLAGDGTGRTGRFGGGGGGIGDGSRRRRRSTRGESVSSSVSGELESRISFPPLPIAQRPPPRAGKEDRTAHALDPNTPPPPFARLRRLALGRAIPSPTELWVVDGAGGSIRVYDAGAREMPTLPGSDPEEEGGFDSEDEGVGFGGQVTGTGEREGGRKGSAWSIGGDVVFGDAADGVLFSENVYGGLEMELDRTGGMGGEVAEEDGQGPGEEEAPPPYGPLVFQFPLLEKRLMTENGMREGELGEEEEKKRRLLEMPTIRAKDALKVAAERASIAAQQHRTRGMRAKEREKSGGKSGKSVTASALAKAREDVAAEATARNRRKRAAQAQKRSALAAAAAKAGMTHSSLRLKYTINITGAAASDAFAEGGGGGEESGKSGKGTGGKGRGKGAEKGRGGKEKVGDEPGIAVTAICILAEDGVVAIAQGDSRISLWSIDSIGPPPSDLPVTGAHSREATSTQSGNSAGGRGGVLGGEEEAEAEPPIRLIGYIATRAPVGKMAVARGCIYGAMPSIPGVVSVWDIRTRQLLHESWNHPDLTQQARVMLDRTAAKVREEEDAGLPGAIRPFPAMFHSPPGRVGNPSTLPDRRLIAELAPTFVGQRQATSAMATQKQLQSIAWWGTGRDGGGRPAASDGAKLPGHVVTSILAITPHSLGLAPPPPSVGLAAAAVRAPHIASEMEHAKTHAEQVSALLGATVPESGNRPDPATHGLLITASLGEDVVVHELAPPIDAVLEARRLHRDVRAKSPSSPMRGHTTTSSSSSLSFAATSSSSSSSSSSSTTRKKDGTEEKKGPRDHESRDAEVVTRPLAGGRFVAKLKTSSGVRDMVWVESAGLLLTVGFAVFADAWSLPDCRHVMRLSGHRAPILGVREIWQGPGGMGMSGAAARDAPVALTPAQRAGGLIRDSKVVARALTLDEAGTVRVYDLTPSPTGEARCVGSFTLVGASGSDLSRFEPRTLSVSRASGEVFVGGARLHHYHPIPALAPEGGTSLGLYNPTLLTFLVAGRSRSSAAHGGVGTELTLRAFGMNGQVIGTLASLGDDPATTMCLDDRQRKLVIGTRYGSVQVLNARSGAPMKRAELPHDPSLVAGGLACNHDRAAEVTAVAYVPGERAIVSVGWDRAIRVHDDRYPVTMAPLRVRKNAHKSDILDISVSSTLQLIATVAADGCLALHDLETLREEGQFHRPPVHQVFPEEDEEEEEDNEDDDEEEEEDEGDGEMKMRLKMLEVRGADGASGSPMKEAVGLDMGSTARGEESGRRGSELSSVWEVPVAGSSGSKATSVVGEGSVMMDGRRGSMMSSEMSSVISDGRRDDSEVEGTARSEKPEMSRPASWRAAGSETTCVDFIAPFPLVAVGDAGGCVWLLGTREAGSAADCNPVFLFRNHAHDDRGRACGREMRRGIRRWKLWARRVERKKRRMERRRRIDAALEAGEEIDEEDENSEPSTDEENADPAGDEDGEPRDAAYTPPPPPIADASSVGGFTTDRGLRGRKVGVTSMGIGFWPWDAIQAYERIRELSDASHRPKPQDWVEATSLPTTGKLSNLPLSSAYDEGDANASTAKPKTSTHIWTMMRPMARHDPAAWVKGDAYHGIGGCRRVLFVGDESGRVRALDLTAILKHTGISPRFRGTKEEEDRARLASGHGGGDHGSRTRRTSILAALEEQTGKQSSSVRVKRRSSVADQIQAVARRRRRSIDVEDGAAATLLDDRRAGIFAERRESVEDVTHDKSEKDSDAKSSRESDGRKRRASIMSTALPEEERLDSRSSSSKKAASSSGRDRKDGVDEGDESGSSELDGELAMAISRADWTDDVPVLATWRAHTGSVVGMQIIRDPPSILTRGDDSSVRLWTPRGDPLGALCPSPLEGIAIRRGYARALPWHFRPNLRVRQKEERNEAESVLSLLEREADAAKRRWRRATATVHTTVRAKTALAALAPTSPVLKELQATEILARQHAQQAHRLARATSSGALDESALVAAAEAEEEEQDRKVTSAGGSGDGGDDDDDEFGSGAEGFLDESMKDFSREDRVVEEAMAATAASRSALARLKESSVARRSSISSGTIASSVDVLETKALDREARFADHAAARERVRAHLLATGDHIPDAQRLAEAKEKEVAHQAVAIPSGGTIAEAIRAAREAARSVGSVSSPGGGSTEPGSSQLFGASVDASFAPSQASFPSFWAEKDVKTGTVQIIGGEDSILEDGVHNGVSTVESDSSSDEEDEDEDGDQVGTLRDVERKKELRRVGTLRVLKKEEKRYSYSPGKVHDEDEQERATLRLLHRSMTSSTSFVDPGKKKKSSSPTTSKRSTSPIVVPGTATSVTSEASTTTFSSGGEDAIDDDEREAAEALFGVEQLGQGLAREAEEGMFAAGVHRRTVGNEREVARELRNRLRGEDAIHERLYPHLVKAVEDRELSKPRDDGTRVRKLGAGVKPGARSAGAFGDLVQVTAKSASGKRVDPEEARSAPSAWLLARMHELPPSKLVAAGHKATVRKHVRTAAPKSLSTSILPKRRHQPPKHPAKLRHSLSHDVGEMSFSAGSGGTLSVADSLGALLEFGDASPMLIDLFGATSVKRTGSAPPPALAAAEALTPARRTALLRRAASAVQSADSSDRAVEQAVSEEKKASGKLSRVAQTFLAGAAQRLWLRKLSENVDHGISRVRSPTTSPSPSLFSSSLSGTSPPPSITTSLPVLPTAKEIYKSAKSAETPSASKSRASLPPTPSSRSGLRTASSMVSRSSSASRASRSRGRGAGAVGGVPRRELDMAWQIFRMIDVDGSGEVDVREFTEGPLFSDATEAAEGEESLERSLLRQAASVFSSMDLDSSGTVTVDEWFTVLFRDRVRNVSQVRDMLNWLRKRAEDAKAKQGSLAAAVLEHGGEASAAENAAEHGFDALERRIRGGRGSRDG